MLLACPGAPLQVHAVAQPLAADPYCTVPPGWAAVLGPGRALPLAKDSAWVRERAPLEGLRRPGAVEVLLANAAGGLLEGLVTNFFVISGGWHRGRGWGRAGRCESGRPRRGRLGVAAGWTGSYRRIGVGGLMTPMLQGGKLAHTSRALSRRCQRCRPSHRLAAGVGLHTPDRRRKGWRAGRDGAAGGPPRGGGMRPDRVGAAPRSLTSQCLEGGLPHQQVHFCCGAPLQRVPSLRHSKLWESLRQLPPPPLLTTPTQPVQPAGLPEPHQDREAGALGRGPATL